MSQYSKRSKIRGNIDLKTPIDRSHNRDSDDERIIALVRFLARRAAEQDYRIYKRASASPENIDGDN